MKKTKFCTACNRPQEVKKTEINENGKIHFLFCGHRVIEISIRETVKAYELREVKKKNPKLASKRHPWRYEALSGERQGGDGDFVLIERTFDREKDIYKEKVTKDGKIIANKKERLSEHKIRKQ